MTRKTIDTGIDLGTTTTVIATMDGDEPRVIPNRLASMTTASAVAVDKRGRLTVGEEAKQRFASQAHDGDVVALFKQRMGQGAEGAHLFRTSGRRMSPEELSAEVLKSVRGDFQTQIGWPPRAAVVTVPAAFENAATRATMEAAKLAGIETCILLLEPVAASLAYGFQTEDEKGYWFVYDFGGGTFDAAVMRLTDGMIQVVAHNGDNRLGGKLIDQAILEQVFAVFLAERYDLSDFAADPRWEAARQRLMVIAEKAKIEICISRADLEIYEESLFQDAAGATVDLECVLTVERLEEICRPLVERTLNLCRRTLKEEHLQVEDMSRVLLVGGSTLNPFVRAAVEREFGKPADFSIDPVTCVARGAAIFASTQWAPDTEDDAAAEGAWTIELEHEPVGSVADPDIGGRVAAPEGRDSGGMTVEFIDARTGWRSGQETLGPGGAFFSQLFAEPRRRHTYDIELIDSTGVRVPTTPAQVTYMMALETEDPPATWDIGIGLADGGVARYLAKGARIPREGYRRSIDHVTSKLLRAGEAEDVLRIPLLEGDNPRAERNHYLGEMKITGADLRRDLEAGSEIEITLLMDQSQQIRLQTYIPALDQDIEMPFNPVTELSAPEALSRIAAEQRTRLADLQARARETGSAAARDVIDEIEAEAIPAEIEGLEARAAHDAEAATALDRLLRRLGARLDVAEDAVEWPALMETTRRERADFGEIVGQYGDGEAAAKLRAVEAQIEAAIAAGDPEAVHRALESLKIVAADALDRHEGFHFSRFDYLCERRGDMRDPDLVEKIVAQGKRAVASGDLTGVRAANRQLASRLPSDDPGRKTSVNQGDIYTREF